MSEYDFRGLTAYDFECLVRDLLQAELSESLEAFGHGADEGIDLRCSRGNGDLIVQCKHYAGSGYGSLRRHLRTSELPKVRALAPARYILATSVPLTPKRKNELADILAPFVAAPRDIYGPDDLNGLLARHPGVEKRHFKLWLTSTEVLRAVLHSDIYARSEDLLERIHAKAKLFVQSEAYPRAQETLQEHHCCIVAGVPGIGKTTLAEMLLLDHAASGFEVVSVSGDIDEAWTAWERNTNQIFYYDDFLGQTTSAEKLGKNEDRRLLDLIARTRKSARKRLILTTREYILNDARTRYERLALGGLDLFKLVIDLADYSPFQRAQILYNHVFFSDLSGAFRTEFVQQGWYTQVVGHPNFNPRLIEQAVLQAESDALTSSRFRDRMLEILTHPALLWDHVFEHQITDDARDLLRVLLIFESDAALEDLEGTLSRFWGVTSEAVHTRVRNALRIIEGTFTSTTRRRVYSAHPQTFVAFQNASVRDFLKPTLGNSHSVGRLISAATHFEQLDLLYRYASHHDASSSMRTAFTNAGEAILDTCVRLFEAPRLTVDASAPFRLQSREYRLHQCVRMAQTVSRAANAQWILERMDALCRSWERGEGGDRLQIIALLRTLDSEADALGYPISDWTRSAKRFLTAEFEDPDDAQSFLAFSRAFPSQVGEEDEQAARKAFEAMVAAEVARLEGDADADEVDQALDELRAASDSLDVDVEWELSHLEELRATLLARESSDVPPSRTYCADEDESADEDEARIASLFESLE